MDKVIALVLETVISSSLLIVMIMLIRRLFYGRINPMLQYSIWIIVLLRLLVPVSFENIFKPIHIPILIETQAEQFFQQESNPQIIGNVEDAAPYIPANNTGIITSNDENAKTVKHITGTQIIVAVWVVGVVVTLSYMFFINIGFVRKIRNKQPVYLSEREYMLFGKIRKKLRVFVCDSIPSPCLVGILRPYIVVNTDALKTEEILCYVLLHEINHYKRADNFISLLRNCVCVLYWFNPLVWIAAGISRNDCELACDAAVISGLNDRESIAYGEVLISLIQKKKSVILQSTTMMTSGKRILMERIKLIAQKPKTLTAAFLAMATLILSAALVACALPLSFLPSSSSKTSSPSLLSAGWNHSMAIKSDGTLWAWGNNNNGKLDNGKPNVFGEFIWDVIEQNDEASPIQILGDVASVSVSSIYSMAIKTDGTLWAWGSNEYGQLGDGTRTVYNYDENYNLINTEVNDKSEPIQIMSDVASVSAGMNHALAVKNDGTLWAWGVNEFGQLGNGTTVDSTVPLMIMNDVVMVSAGAQCSMAIKTDGTLWAWGRNLYGGLGDGTKTTYGYNTADEYSIIKNNDRLSPIQIMSNVSYISTGGSFCMAIKKDGTLWAWGSNLNGTLGNGKMTIYDETGTAVEDNDILIPEQIMSDVESVSAGGSHTLAVKSDGTLWAWGWNIFGQVGDGATLGEDISVPSPVQIMSDVANASAGFFHSLAVKTDGTLWTWGSNDSGQLGNGTVSVNSSVPERVMDGMSPSVD